MRQIHRAVTQPACVRRIGKLFKPGRRIAVLAKALSLTKIDKLAIDDGDFRFANVKSWRDPNFLPGAIKYGDLPAMLAMCQSGSTWVGTSDVAKANAAQAVFAKVDGKPTFIATDSGVTDAVEWLAK